MKTLLFFLLTVLLSSSIVIAQQPDTNRNPLIDQNDFKHNKKYFLAHYGTDDSTKALINTFFRVRKAAAVEVAYSIVGGVGLYIFVNHIFGQGDNKSFDYGTVFLAIFAIPIIPAFAVGVAEGTVTHLIYTRKKLLHLIADYHAGKHLPKRFTHRTRYRQELRKVKGIKPSIWNILFST
ncbi:hypothetical protein [Mucilaginibacter sp.]|uniref:hypothetical protein n=1 Tax=Mucilaginibacter sp. TaxID=1882438 RepID=UPI003AFFB029